MTDDYEFHLQTLLYRPHTHVHMEKNIFNRINQVKKKKGHLECRYTLDRALRIFVKMCL